MDTAAPILEVQQLTRTFPGVVALSGVSLALRGGEVHGLVGENGAGKSTLVKLLAGVHTPTSGQIRLEGRPVSIRHPAGAMELGIAMVHQELNLIPELSVAENIFLGREIRRLGLLRRGRMHAEARRLLEQVGCRVPPGRAVASLSIAQQQMVEIAKALSVRARVLILDEPTAVLSGAEVEGLFALIGRLTQRGVTVLYISHILPEVLRLCDRVTVLRDGQLVTTLARAQLGQGPAAETKLASLMVGRPMADHFPPRRALAGDAPVRLAVEHLWAEGGVADVSLSVRAGEIVGLAGLVGAGRTESAEALFGLRRRLGGRVTLDGKPFAPRSPREAAGAGLAYLSEDRKARGLLLDRSLEENFTLASLNRFGRWLLRGRPLRRAAETQARAVALRARSLDQSARSLSGGNQQKVYLGRWLLTSPGVLILDEPTRGVDIGAKEEIYRLIAELAGGGTACVVISSEINELLGLCHRLAVMRGGRTVATLGPGEMTEQAVMHHAAGVSGT